MIDFDIFMPLIKPRAQGVPEPIAINAIRQAAIEFCTLVKLWRGTDMFYATNIDDIALPDGAELVKIVNARFNGVALEPVSFDEMNQRFPTTDWQNMTGETPRYFTQINTSTIKVIPTCDGYVELSLILKPSYDAMQLPNFLAEYRQIIADGALGEIFSIPNQNYSNADLAIFHAGKFNSMVDRLIIKSVEGKIGAPVRSKPNYF